MKLSCVSIILSATVIASARPAVEAPQDCVSSEADVGESNAVHLRTDESDAKIPTYQFGFCSSTLQDCFLCVNGVLRRTSCYPHRCTHTNNACSHSLLTAVTVCS
ncbi:hypothetical protein ASPFODRAFT_632769 [Aspergillus luchuensis CBS 106.47]|uniref:Uncharacterized protein n=1 Tax=Aspergillus luchuensis (strain CBS 106.47) TaxID=1137211 RepID=A0A1M3TGQ7_ASPLC|nr:hypothetical protein ASPFODRAFT_632769 [Aspergillus luchuensis CBS 106.47]